MSSKYKKSKLKPDDLEDDNNDDPLIESDDTASDEEIEVEQSGGDTDAETEARQDLSDDEHLDLDPDNEPKDSESDEYDPVQEEELAEEDPEEPGEEVEPEEDGAVVGEDFVVESKSCYAKNLNKDNLVMDEDDSSMYGKLEYKRIPDSERDTDPIMTYYEMVRIIGTRAQQFNLGAPPLVLGIDGLHPAKMAYIELMAQMTPFIVRRHLPSKKYEEWRVDELQLIHQIDDEFFVPEEFDLETFKKKNNILQPKQLKRSEALEPTDAEHETKTPNKRTKTVRSPKLPGAKN